MWFKKEKKQPRKGYWKQKEYDMHYLYLANGMHIETVWPCTSGWRSSGKSDFDTLEQIKRNREQVFNISTEE